MDHEVCPTDGVPTVPAEVLDEAEARAAPS